MSLSPLVFELVGPAGVGKTAVLRAIARLAPLIRTGVRMDRMRQLPTIALSIAVLTPALVDMFFGDAHRFWPGLRHLTRLRTFPAEIARAQDSGHRTILLDEGPVFSLGRLSVFHHAATGRGSLGRRWCHELARCSTLLSGIVYLDARNDVLAERIHRRLKPHQVKHRSDREVNEFLDRYRAAYRAILGRFTTDRRVQIVEIDTTTATIEQVAAEALTALDGWSRRFDATTANQGT